MTDQPHTLCRTCATPIGYVDCPTGSWWAHETHPADEHDAVPGAWVDGDPLMETIAAEVWEHCERGGNSTVFDDPRNIAGTAAAVARRMLAPTPPAVPVSSPPPDQTALRDRIAEAAIKASPFHELRTVDHAQNGPLQITVRVDELADVLVRRLAAAPPPATRAAVYREVADRLTTDAHGMQPDWARIYKRDAAVKVREWAEQLDGEARQDDTTPRPVQHAPGKAVLCPDCLTKGHAVCMPDEQPPAHTGRTADDCP